MKESPARKPFKTRLLASLFIWLLIGVALAFITLAIPIQFKSNWIAIAWAIEGLVILWAGIEIKSARLRAVAHAPDGVIEGMESPPGSPRAVLAVQWHPEELLGDGPAWDRRLFQQFAESVRQGGAVSG